MPCNYTGYYDVGTLAGFGYAQFDWSSRKDECIWCQAHPMTAAESISNHSAALHAMFGTEDQDRSVQVRG